LKLAAPIGAVAAVVLVAALWFFVLQPGQRDDVAPAAESLKSGIAHYEAGEYTMALEDLALVPPGSAEEARALYYQGSTHMMLKDFEAAATVLDQALALNPGNPGTLYALGVVWFKLGEISLSKGYFAAVLEINPNDEQAKGLMDIMSGLERRSVAESEGEQTPETQ
jgi:tetratricopeptide (TPR) repeat protein